MPKNAHRPSFELDGALLPGDVSAPRQRKIPLRPSLKVHGAILRLEVAGPRLPKNEPPPSLALDGAILPFEVAGPRFLKNPLPPWSHRRPTEIQPSSVSVEVEAAGVEVEQRPLGLWAARKEGLGLRVLYRRAWLHSISSRPCCHPDTPWTSFRCAS